MLVVLAAACGLQPLRQGCGSLYIGGAKRTAPENVRGDQCTPRAVSTAGVSKQVAGFLVTANPAASHFQEESWPEYPAMSVLSRRFCVTHWVGRLDLVPVRKQGYAQSRWG